MNELCLLAAIVRREEEEAYLRFLQSEGAATTFSIPCNGTANAGLLDLLGLEKTEKTLLYALIDHTRAQNALRRMISTLGLNLPGNGIALCIPVGSIGGSSSLKALTDPQKENEVKTMEGPFAYELVVAITKHGCAAQVMDAARGAGAKGGTILHAKGTGAERDVSFFGVSLAAEKEMVLIVTRRREKDAIMRAVMEHAGVHTSAHTVLFSLPVSDVAGLVSLMEDPT